MKLTYRNKTNKMSSALSLTGEIIGFNMLETKTISKVLIPNDDIELVSIDDTTAPFRAVQINVNAGSQQEYVVTDYISKPIKSIKVLNLDSVEFDVVLNGDANSTITLKSLGSVEFEEDEINSIYSIKIVNNSSGNVTSSFIIFVYKED